MPSKKAKPKLTKEQIEERRKKNRERQKLYRQKQKEKKEAQVKSAEEKRTRVQPERRCRKSSVIEQDTDLQHHHSGSSDGDSDYNQSRKDMNRVRQRKRRAKSALAGNVKDQEAIEARKLADRLCHSAKRRSLRDSVNSGNEADEQKVEAERLANREQHAEKIRICRESAKSGNAEAQKEIETRKTINRVRHEQKRTSRRVSAIRGDEEAIEQTELIKSSNRIRHVIRRSSRRANVKLGSVEASHEEELERMTNQAQHKKHRLELERSALTGNEDSASKVGQRRKKDKEKHAKRRKTKKSVEPLPVPHYLGKMDVECPYCGALHFPGERRCCYGGTVFVPPEKKMPEAIHHLLYDVNRAQHKDFMKHIIYYNSLFAFGSIQYTHVHQEKHGVQSAKTLGSIRHFTSAVYPNRKNLPLFGNFYTYDHVLAAEHRSQSKYGAKLDKNIIKTLSEVFEINHPYSKFYRNMKDIIDGAEKAGKETNSVKMRIVEFDEFERRNLNIDLQGTHRGVYSTSRCGDFVSLYTSTDVDQNILPRGVNVYQKLGRNIPRTLFSWRREVDSFSYPIIAPYGEPGFKEAFWEHQKPKPFNDRLEEFIENDTENVHAFWDEIEDEVEAELEEMKSDNSVSTDMDLDISDDEESYDRRRKKGTRRRIMVPSDSDVSDENEKTHVEVEMKKRKDTRRRIMVPSESEESDEDEETHVEVEMEKRKDTRRRIMVPSESEESDEDEGAHVDAEVDIVHEDNRDGNRMIKTVKTDNKHDEMNEMDGNEINEEQDDLNEDYDKEYEKTIEPQVDSDSEMHIPNVRFEYRQDEFYPSNTQSSTNNNHLEVESDSDNDDLTVPNVVHSFKQLRNNISFQTLMMEGEDVSEDEEIAENEPNIEELDQEEEVEIEGHNDENDENDKNEDDEMNEKLNPETAEAEGAREKHGRYVSRAQYVLYRSQRRKRFHSRLCSTGKLGQLYQMDQFSRVIQNRMFHIRKHHTQTMLSTRKKLLEALQRKVDKKKAGVTIGAVTSVPATVMGSPRYMRRKFEDAVAMANKLGNPSVFLTFTASSHWREIKETLGSDTWSNNPYVVTEAFKKKYEKLLEVVCGKPVSKGSKKRRKGIWGEVEWYTFSVEFQQRGAPHIHLLLRLKNPPKTGDEVDLISQAVLPVVPDVNDPSYASIKRLRDLVEQHHVHRPCENDKDAYCQVGKKDNWKQCKKRFPKEFKSHTELGDRRYPDLRRPDDGEYCEKKTDTGTYRADNRHIVAYNPTLLSLFETHINVEIVTSGGALKYLYKYVFKGFDRVLLETFSSDGTSYGSSGEMLSNGYLLYPKDAKMQKGVEIERQQDAVKLLRDENISLRDSNGNKMVVYDETKMVEDMRAFTATEAAWHMSNYRITGCSHSIVSVFVHTPHEEPIHFEAGTEGEIAERDEDEFRTYLKSWFNLNKQDGKAGEMARSITYDEMPRFFGQKNGNWILRKRNWSGHIIGHIKSVHPRNIQQFAIRLLAQVVKGPTSFEDLRTVDGVVCNSFVDAAKKRRLMNDQVEWMNALKEASLTELPIVLRRLFIAILVFNSPSNALELWIENKGELVNRNTWSVEKKEAHALNHISSGLRAHGITLAQLGLPEVNVSDLPGKDDWNDDNEGEDMSTMDHAKIAEERYEKLNEDQKLAMDVILKDLKNNKHSCYFVHGTGGTGKTYLYRTLYHRLKANGLKVLSVAHTGIAATLLPAGQTAHRAFSIPLLVEEKMHSKLEFESEWADYLKDVDVVIFDEATMLDRRVLDSIDELFVLLHPERQGMPFGGVVFLFGGDWRQTLPIVDRVRGEAIIPYTIQRSDLWKKLHLLALKKNERASADPEYAKWLDSIGNGRSYVDVKWQLTKLPHQILAQSEYEVINWMFGNGRIDDPATSDFSCLLTVDNATTEELNDIALKYIKNDMTTYESIDVYDLKSGFEFLPPESYHNMMPSGLPPHLLNLKIGCVVILLRNINVHLGLCNGTRMRVVELGKEIVKCHPITKNGKTPDVVVLSRIAMSAAKPTSKDVAFIRTQFPIRVAHSMTINKSQGQTLDRVGVILRTPVFSHGQFYVACSRVRQSSDIKIFVHNKDSPDTTRNVVFHDILLD